MRQNLIPQGFVSFLKYNTDEKPDERFVFAKVVQRKKFRGFTAQSFKDFANLYTRSVSKLEI